MENGTVRRAFPIRIGRKWNSATVAHARPHVPARDPRQALQWRALELRAHHDVGGGRAKEEACRCVVFRLGLRKIQKCFDFFFSQFWAAKKKEFKNVFFSRVRFFLTKFQSVKHFDLGLLISICHYSLGTHLFLTQFVVFPS